MVQKQASQIKRQQFIDVLNDCHLISNSWVNIFTGTRENSGFLQISGIQKPMMRAVVRLKSWPSF